ncbi:hypothetical protein Tco_1430692 [Tanacetum coccineum]
MMESCRLLADETSIKEREELTLWVLRYRKTKKRRKKVRETVKLHKEDAWKKKGVKEQQEESSKKQKVEEEKESKEVEEDDEV